MNKTCIDHTIADHFRCRLLEEVRQPASRFGVLSGGVILEPAEWSFVQDDRLLPLQRKRRVEQFAREHSPGIRQYQEGASKLAALCSMHCDGIGQLEVVVVLTKIASKEVVGEPRLRTELDLSEPWIP